jgi:hypothetical protein
MRALMADPQRLDDRQEMFLRAMLRLEPSQWATEGICQLESFRKTSGPSAARPVEPPSQTEIEEILQLLELCKKNFWHDSSEPWVIKLQEANFEKFPELKPAAQRIHRWYRVRPELLQLVDKMGNDSLAGKLQLMATMSAREMAILKANISHQRPRWFGPNYRKQAKRIKREFPEVYGLDPKWFDELCFWPNMRYR